MNDHHRVAAVGFAVLLAAAGWPSEAVGQDIVRLTTGGIIEGEVLSDSTSGVTIRVPRGTITIERNMVRSVDRATPIAGESEGPDRAPRRPSVDLSLHTDRESWFFLERQGRRVGVRRLSRAASREDGLLGWQIVDRRLFLAGPGAKPDVTLESTEFVEAGRGARSMALTLETGRSERRVEGDLGSDGRLLLRERREAQEEPELRSLPAPKGLEFPGSFRLSLREGLGSTGRWSAARLFDPLAQRFERIIPVVSREVRRIRGEDHPVTIVRLERLGRGNATALELWLDVEGELLREELGDPSLVALRTTEVEARNYLVGKGGQSAPDSQLAIRLEHEGLAMRRPDLAWEQLVRAQGMGPLLTLVRAADRSTLDLFRLEGESAEDLEGAALELVRRMARRSKGLTVESLGHVTLAGEPALRMRLQTSRHGTVVRTEGWLFGREGRVYALLGAAPRPHFSSALAAFDEVANSLVLLPSVVTAPANPFERKLPDGLETGR